QTAPARPRPRALPDPASSPSLRVLLDELAAAARRVDLAARERHRFEHLLADEGRLLIRPFARLSSTLVCRRFRRSLFTVHAHAPSRSMVSLPAASALTWDFSQSADEGPRMFPSM